MDLSDCFSFFLFIFLFLSLSLKIDQERTLEQVYRNMS